jgi:ribosomal protein S14
MEQKFTIRPKPKVGESLSGYLIRISEMNCTKFWCVKNYIGVRTNGTSSLDTLPQRVANMPKLINLLGIDEESILKMTFWNLFNKFYSNINVNNVNFKIVISDRFVVHKRRFCANCLRESGYYRIVWQIRDIDMCDIHFTKIQSRCSLCGTEQPYISNSLGEFLCFKCGNDLSKQIEPIINDSNYINEQLKIINDWLFLLDEKFSLDSYSHEYGKE